MNLERRTDAFVKLGSLLHQQLPETAEVDIGGLKNVRIKEVVGEAFIQNPWFTHSNILYSLRAIANMLKPEKLARWTGLYPELNTTRDPLKVGIVMAGNIPLVGFHDLLAVLIAGHGIQVKYSRRDEVLIKYIGTLLIEIEPEFESLIDFTHDQLSAFHAIMATGSDNSSRYFQYYFGKYPNIIRKNRNSVAVITGNESGSELAGLADDVFLYFGLGCRNVSKLYIPPGYVMETLLPAFEKYGNVTDHTGYANNYLYNRTLLQMNKIEHIDNGFVVLREESRPNSPIGVLHYEIYQNHEDLRSKLKNEHDSIQCIVSNTSTLETAIPPGKAQTPHPWEYADNIDTLKFLLGLGQ